MTISKIMIAVDRTAASFKAMDMGFSLAESLKKPEVLVIHVIDPAWAMGDPDAGILPEQALAKLKRESENFLQQLIKMYSKSLEPIYLILQGKVVTEIIEAAKNYQADILVLGTHSRKGLANLFVEDVVKEIIPHSPCPILLPCDQ
ncbi:MAG TPA: hypothetical protein DCF68_05050 [Cyanothece sp. UBA12306]|nr:hypothetical protein [Cyanothece sp. UBA12306]